MTSLGVASLSARACAFPFALYQAEQLAFSRRDASHIGFYEGMLREDLRSLHHGYRVSLVIEAKDVEDASRALAVLLTDFQHLGYRADPLGSVFAFVERLLEESSERNCMTLELFKADSEDVAAATHPGRLPSRRSDATLVDLPSLGYMPGWSISRRFRGVRQLSVVAGGSPSRIPSGRIVRHEMSRNAASMWRRTIRDLRAVDGNRLLARGIDHLSWLGYDSAAEIEAERLSAAAAAAPIGWNARELFREMISTPYSTYRRLRFNRFWIEVVRGAVDFLNGLTSSNELYGASSFTFRLDGLPEPEALQDAMQAIRAGSLSCGQARDDLLVPSYSLPASGATT